MRNPTVRLFGILLILAVASCTGVLLTGCTYVSYCAPNQPCVTVLDIHPVGGATDLEVVRADGTTLKATRAQASSEALVNSVVTGVVNALSPVGSAAQ